MNVSNLETPGTLATEPLMALARPWGLHQFQMCWAIGWQSVCSFILGSAKMLSVPRVTRQEL